MFFFGFASCPHVQSHLAGAPTGVIDAVQQGPPVPQPVLVVLRLTAAGLVEKVKAHHAVMKKELDEIKADAEAKSKAAVDKCDQSVVNDAALVDMDVLMADATRDLLTGVLEELPDKNGLKRSHENALRLAATYVKRALAVAAATPEIKDLITAAFLKEALSPPSDAHARVVWKNTAALNTFAGFMTGKFVHQRKAFIAAAKADAAAVDGPAVTWLTLFVRYEKTVRLVKGTLFLHAI